MCIHITYIVIKSAAGQGKWVIVQEHPSNEFFSKFKNCLTYNDPKQFSAHLKTALETDPHPVNPLPHKITGPLRYPGSHAKDDQSV